MTENKRYSFNFEDLVDFVDFSSFRFLLTALSTNKIAIATSRYLIIVEDNQNKNNNTASCADEERLQTVVEFGEISGRPTAIAWIADDIVCVGFESGGLSCFNPFGDTITEIEFANYPVAAIHTYRSQDPKVTEQEVWALYENKFIVSIPISHLLGATGTLSRYYLKFKLMDQAEVHDFLVLPEPYSMNIFDAEMNAPNNSFVVVGVEPSLSLYNVGGKQHFQHLGKLASYVRERVSSAISKTVSNALVSFFGSGGGQEPPEAEDYTPISSSLDFVESSKRRIVRVSLDPTGKLLAAADTLGRVMLFDMRYVSTVLRVWKGVREAHFAWTMDLAPLSSGGGSAKSTGSAPSPVRSYQLSLAIYAPQLGLLSLYQVRHGPCLRSIPVGPQCQIFTVQETAPGGAVLHKCALLRTYADSPLLHLSLVSPFDHADDDIDLNELQAQAEAEAKAEADALQREGGGGCVGKLQSSSKVLGGGGLKLADLLLPHFGIMSPFPPALSSFCSGEQRGSAREESLRLVSKLEKLLKEALLLVADEGKHYTSFSASGEEKNSNGTKDNSDNGNSPSDHTMAGIEHKVWVLLSSPSSHSLFLSSVSTSCYDGEGVALLLHCLSLVERTEVTMYTQQAFMDHALGPSTGYVGAGVHVPSHSRGGGGMAGVTGGAGSSSHNGNCKDCGLMFFSLQFHRNLCRLLEDIGASDMSLRAPSSSASPLPTALMIYAQNRSKVVKAYSMLMELNMHLSLNELTVLAAQCPLPPPEGGGGSSSGTDSPSGSSGGGGSGSSTSEGSSSGSVTAPLPSGALRAEALSWGGRFLRPHYPPPSSSQSMSGPLSLPGRGVSGGEPLDSSGHLEAGTGIGVGGVVEPIVCHQNPLSFFQAAGPVTASDASASHNKDREHCQDQRFSPLPSLPLQSRSVTFPGLLASQFALLSKLPNPSSSGSGALHPQPAGGVASSGLFTPSTPTSSSSSLTAALRNPLSPAVFQPAAIGRYPPFAVYLSFHERPHTRLRVWREHVRGVRRGDSDGGSEFEGNIDVGDEGSSDGSDSDSDSEFDSESETEFEAEPDELDQDQDLLSQHSKRAGRLQERELGRHMRRVLKLTSLNFQFEAFTSLVDRAIASLNSTVWQGGETSSGSSGEADTAKGDGFGGKHFSAMASDLPTWVSREILTFLCLPLLGDVFSVQTVITVFDLMGVGGSGLGLVKTLPMVMVFLEAQSVSLLQQHLTNKSLQASPIQRWLRDTLLQFQAYMASDVEDEEEKGGVEKKGEGNSSHHHHGMRYRANGKKKALLRLLTDVIDSRPMSFDITEEGGEKRCNENANESSQVSDEDHLLIKQTPVPSLDEVVRYLFRPAWLLARRSYHLETSFMLVALVLEVLESISEQLERRTFGEMTLRGTTRAWHVLAKQLRVCLLISSRTGGRVSVDSLGSGEVSLYTLLATDTLCFAMQPEQAVEHELRCQEVYNRRAGGTGKDKEKDSGKDKDKGKQGGKEKDGGKRQSSDSSSKSSGGGALLAWGSSADTRWRELVGIADMEDLVLQETTAITSGTGPGGSTGPYSLRVATRQLAAELLQMTHQMSLLLVTTPAPLSSSSVALSLSCPGSPGAHKTSLSAPPSPLLLSASISPSVSSSSAAISPLAHTHSRNARKQSSSKEHKKVRRRRPLLLFFPAHNQPAALAAYRACALADRWRKRPKRLEILTLAGAHLFPLPPVTRAAVAEYILVTSVFPLLREYVQIEEGGVGHQIQQSCVPMSRGKTPPSSFFSGGREAQMQELVVVLADPDLAQQFVQACLELLTATLHVIDAPTPTLTTYREDKRGAGGGDAPDGVHGRTRAASLGGGRASRHRSNTMTSTASVCFNAYNYMSPLAYKEEASDLANWPGTQDTKLTLLVRQFRDKRGASEEAVRQHMALLWVLQLRTQCGLRGVKLSELFGTSLLQAFVTDTSLNCPSTVTNVLSFSAQLSQQKVCMAALKAPSDPATRGGGGAEEAAMKHCAHLQRLREEFLMQCLRRLESQPSTLVYNIADIWGFEGRTIRLGHLQIVLQLGMDEVAEALIGQIDAPSSSVMDCVTQGVRQRVGGCLAMMERISSCGPVLASLDPECYSWAREASGPPDHLELEEVLQGRRKVVSFDVPASRHLVIRVQALLLLVPQSQRQDSWRQRKSECDALLSLLSALALAPSTDTQGSGVRKNAGIKT